MYTPNKIDKLDFLVATHEKSSKEEFRKSLEIMTEKFSQDMPKSDLDYVCLPIIEKFNNASKFPIDPKELFDLYEKIKAKIPDDIDKKDIGNPLSLKELVETEFPKIRFAIEGLFETGTINMLSAPPNSWKSWIILACAISLASGKELFQKFKTEKQGVLIVNEEDTAPMLQERMNMLMGEKEDIPIYFYIGKDIKIEEEFIERIIGEAKNKQVGFIVFDSLRAVHSADENSSQEMQVVMDNLKKITKEGFTVLFTHHHRKRGGYGKKDNTGEESRGSSAINASIHGHLACEEWKNEDKTYLIISQPKLKSAKKLDPFNVLIEISADLKKVSFNYDGEHKDNEKSLNETRQTIENQIYESEEWLSKKDLVSITNKGATTINVALKILESQKIIQSKNRSEIIKLGLPVRSTDGQHNEKLYFRPKEEKEDEFFPADFDV